MRKRKTPLRNNLGFIQHHVREFRPELAFGNTRRCAGLEKG